MSISRDALYGADQPSSPGEAARTARFVIPRGTSPAAPLDVRFIARAVKIDNASGAWYRVASRYVPPWTIGAVVALDPPSAQISVTAITPPGQLAEAVGEDMVVVATEEPLASLPGTVIGSVLPNLRKVQATMPLVAANGPSGIVIVAAPGAGLRLRLWACSFQFWWPLDIPARTAVSVGENIAAGGLMQDSLDGFSGTNIAIPGGVPTSLPNVGLWASSRCNIANVTIIAFAYYTTDVV